MKWLHNCISGYAIASLADFIAFDDYLAAYVQPDYSGSHDLHEVALSVQPTDHGVVFIFVCWSGFSYEGGEQPTPLPILPGMFFAAFADMACTDVMSLTCSGRCSPS